MKGIISRALEVKAIYDNMAEDVRPTFFLITDQGAWWRICGFNRLNVECEYRHGWIFLYGDDPKNRCELVFYPDEETGKVVPAEYTVWNEFGQRTYHRFLKKF